MKERKHQTSTFEETLEQIEQIIEGIDPGKVVRVDDVTAKVKAANLNNAIVKATKMMLMKYGIEYKEE